MATHHRTILTVLIITAISITTHAYDTTIDKKIAKYSAIIAGNKLSEDLTDDKALTLFRMAGAINQKDENFLYTHALLARDMKPEKVDTNVTLEKLLSVMRSRAVYLHEKVYPKNSAVSDLILLYCKVFEKYQAADRKILVIQQSLAVDGVTAELENLLDNQVELQASTPETSQLPRAPQPSTPINQVVAIDTKMDLQQQNDAVSGLFELDRELEHTDKGLQFPEPGGWIESKFKFVGDFILSCRGHFDGLYFEVDGKEIFVKSRTRDERWITLTRSGNELTAKHQVNGNQGTEHISSEAVAVRVFTKRGEASKLEQLRIQGRLAPGARPSTTVVKAVNAGGGAAVSQDRTFIFEADTGFSGGEGSFHYGDISKTENDYVYMSHHHSRGTVTYQTDLPRGRYKVTLMFSETWFDRRGKRSQDVYVEGKKVISELDTYGEARKNTAYDRSFRVTLVDGTLNIRFVALEDQANPCGIIIERD